MVEVNGEPYTETLTFLSGQEVTIEALPDQHWQFDGWSGDLAGEQNPLVISMDGHKEITAHFSEIPDDFFTITLDTIGDGVVLLNGQTYTTPKTFEEGTVIELEAIPEAGKQFGGWYGDLLGLDNPLTFTLINHTTVTAVFASDQIPSDTSVPDTIISQGGFACFHTIQTLIVANNDKQFAVEAGGHAELVAGQNILLMPGTMVHVGGYFSARIASDGVYCDRSSAEDDATADIVTSIDEPAPTDDAGFRVYPNPTASDFTLELKNFDERRRMRVEILDIAGNIVFSDRLPAMQFHHFSLTQQPPGIYIIRVIYNDRANVQRLIKR